MSSNKFLLIFIFPQFNTLPNSLQSVSTISRNFYFMNVKLCSLLRQNRFVHTELQKCSTARRLYALQIYYLRGGGDEGDEKYGEGACMNPVHQRKSVESPVKKSTLDFCIKARKKMMNRAGKKLKRKWIGGAPIPETILRKAKHEVKAIESRDMRQQDRIPTEKVS